MRLFLAASLALALTGCVLKKTPNAVAATPIAPKPLPAAPAPPPPPAEPLSVHQTNVELPAPQPISDEALSTMQLPEENNNPAPAPRNKGKKPNQTSSAKPEQPKTEAPKPEAPKPETPAGPTPAAPPQIRAIVPAEEQQQWKQKADEVRRETQQRIAQVRGHSGELSTIQSMLKLSTDAESRGELRQAFELADRALVLAKELTGGK